MSCMAWHGMSCRLLEDEVVGGSGALHTSFPLVKSL
jgi:hypothetical protein